MKSRPRYTCPVCGKKYFKYIDMELCADLDTKKKRNLIPITEHKIKQSA